MDDWNSDDDESMDESMHEPVAKRAKRGRDGVPTHLDIEAENVKARLEGLKVSDDSSDDDFPSRMDGDLDVSTSEVKNAKRMVMNSAKKVKERARRGKMADSVRSLRSLVPGCADEKKVNQSQVLANTVTYITKVQVQMAHLQRELESLKSQVTSPQARSDGDQSSSSKGFAFAPAKNTSLSSRQRQSSNSRNASLGSSILGATATSAPPATDTKTSFSRPVLKLTNAPGATARVRGNRGMLGAPIAIDPVSPPVPHGTSSADSGSPHNTNTDKKTNTVPLFGAHSTSPSSYAMSPFVPFVPFYPKGTDPSSAVKPHTPTGISPMLDHSLHAPSTPHSFSLSTTDMPPLGASPLTAVSYMAAFSYTSEDLGPELPAEWGPSSAMPDIPQIPNAPTRGHEMYDASGMLMDDIEEVGSWPLYHPNQGGNAPQFDPYTGTSSSAMAVTTAPTPESMGYTQQTQQHQQHEQHHHHHQQRMSDAAAAAAAASAHQEHLKNLCECGERPVY